MTAEAVATLNLFVEKVERLEQSSLLRALLERGSKVTVKWSAQDSQLRVAHTAPTQDEVDAFVLTLRLFRQNNDRISLNNVGKLYESLPISAELKKHYEMHRANLNEFLDAHTFIAIDGDRPTKREVFETVLYGHLAHLELPKQERYRKWMVNPVAGSMIEFEFVGVLDMFRRTLSVMAEIHRRALKELAGNPQKAKPEATGEPK